MKTLWIIAICTLAIMAGTWAANRQKFLERYDACAAVMDLSKDEVRFETTLCAVIGERFGLNPNNTFNVHKAWHGINDLITDPVKANLTGLILDNCNNYVDELGTINNYKIESFVKCMYPMMLLVDGTNLTFYSDVEAP